MAVSFVWSHLFDRGGAGVGSDCQNTLDTYVFPETLRVAHPCAQSRSTVHPEHNGPESRHHTPLAMIVLSIGDTIGVSRARVGSDCQDRERQGSRDRADMDVLVASPGNHYPPWLPTDDTVGQQ